jgi:CheY-like chemotaxis protein
MPVMDGPTFVRQLRERSGDLPILMVSGSPEAHQEGAEAGISFFLDKSEINARLAPVVRSLLESPGTDCQTRAFASRKIHRSGLK